MIHRPKDRPRNGRHAWMLPAGLGAALFMSACSAETSDQPAASSETTGPWSFVDDRSVTATLGEVPDRIVAYETAAAGLMGFGVDSVVGVFGSAPLAESSYLTGLDITGIEDVGSVYGEINLEAVAALQPDIIVTTAYIDERTGADASNIQLGGVIGPQGRNQLAAIAPIVGIDELLPASAFIGRFEELAATLGIDVDSPEVAAGHERFDAAVAALRSTLADAADAADLSVMAVYGGTDALYVAQPAPREFQDLPEFAEWGMNVVDPASDDQYWEVLSWEQADTYPADIILVDSRPGSTQIEDMPPLSPTWNRLPAVKAGQLYAWQPYVSTSIYDTYAEEIENLTALIASARDVA